MHEYPSSKALRAPVLACGVLAATILLSGCQKHPGGQVIAVVNNEEVTAQELNAEAQAASLPASSAGDKSAVAALLQRVIDRNLLADYARREGLDRGPDYVARKRQLEQSLLADLAVRRLAGPIGRPSEAEISAYIAAHPLLFAERQKLDLDQIRFPTPANANVLKSITGLPTVAEVVGQLNSQSIRFERGTAALDTGGIDSASVKQILALKPGEAFAVTAGDLTYVNVVTARTPMPIDRSVWSDIASNAIQTERFTKAIAASLKQLRSASKIEYDQAYKPAK